MYRSGKEKATVKPGGRVASSRRLPSTLGGEGVVGPVYLPTALALFAGVSQTPEAYSNPRRLYSVNANKSSMDRTAIVIAAGQDHFDCMADLQSDAQRPPVASVGLDAQHPGPYI